MSSLITTGALKKWPGSGHINQFATGLRSFSACTPKLKERLVILGSGWGGYEVLRKIDKKLWDVTMVSANSYFAFTPLLAGCAVGTLEFRSAVEPVSAYAPQAKSYQAWCDFIDFKGKLVECTPATLPAYHHSSAPKSLPTKSADEGGTPVKGPRFTLNYDKLVIAVGSYTQTFGIPGVKEHAHFLKDAGNARAIRLRILELFGQANQPTMSDQDRRKLLHFCVVGGGPTGVEFSAELHDLLHTDMARAYPELAPLAKISLYDVAPEILGSFDQSLREYATERFRRNGIEIKAQHHVKRVNEGSMIVKEDGEVPFGLLVWSTGISPNPLINTITDLEKDERSGRLLVNNQLNVVDASDQSVLEDVYAIGDATVLEEGQLPATAQVANQQGRYLAKRLNAIGKRGSASDIPFKFVNLGSMAYLGDWRAIYDRSNAKTGPKTKETGRVAWLFWRSAYFTMTLSWRNKILVPTYWFMNWIFGRDITRF